jgi:HK97 family phage prohead protease
MNGQIELREAPGSNGKLTLEGYASRTETPYEVLGFTETIRRGAFKRSLKEGPDTSLLVNHEGLPIARTTAGTLALSEDENGLRVRAELEPEDPDVQAIAWKMRSGALSEMSMGFRATKQTWNEDRTNRVIHEVALHRGDVSIVSAAASPTSTATLRSMEATLEQRKRMVERIGDRLCGPVGFTFDQPTGSQEYVVSHPAGVSRGRSQIAVPHRPSVTRRSHLEIAKAYAAKGESGTRSPSPSTSMGSARSRPSAGPPVTRYSHINIAKAYALKGSRGHPGSDASVEGEEDEPRYTDAEIEKLGEEGKALKKPGGGFHYPIADVRDVSNAVKDFNRAKSTEPGVRAWIVKRARLLKAEHRLPTSWQLTPEKPAPVGAGTEVGG